MHLKLTCVANSGCKQISGCTKSIPFNALTAIISIHPIAIAMDYETKTEIARQFHIKGPIRQKLLNSVQYGRWSILVYAKKLFGNTKIQLSTSFPFCQTISQINQTFTLVLRFKTTGKITSR